PITSASWPMIEPTMLAVLLPVPIVELTMPRAAVRGGGLLVLLLILSVLLAASGCDVVTNAAVSWSIVKLELPVLVGKPAVRLSWPARLSWTVTVSEPLAAPKVPLKTMALQLILAFTFVLPGP